jgi:hypothetical protein
MRMQRNLNRRRRTLMAVLAKEISDERGCSKIGLHVPCFVSLKSNFVQAIPVPVCRRVGGFAVQSSDAGHGTIDDARKFAAEFGTAVL